METNRAAVNVGRESQTGDVTIGTAAGRDVYAGVPAGELLAIIARESDKEAQYRQLDYSAREIRQAQLDRQLADLASELRLQRYMLICGLVAILVVVVVLLA